MRLLNYDYSMPGAYFVTACTKDRAFLFESPEAKAAVESAWYSLQDIFSNIELAAFVVMPNHIHGILQIMNEGSCRLHPGTWNNDTVRRVGQMPDPTNGTQFETLSNIIGAFKTTTATRINKLRGVIGMPVWQKSFYDRIVRDEYELETIHKYIQHNPVKWAEDRDNPASSKFQSRPTTVDDYWKEIFVTSPQLAMT